MSMKQRTDLILGLRSECMKRGLCGIKSLAVLFRKMDKDFSKSLCWEEFKQGFRIYGIHRTQDQLRLIFNDLDKDGSGSIDFREFLEELRPPMPQCRQDVVNEAFDKLDVIKDELLKVEDLRVIYYSHAESHPKYLSGEWTIDEVLQNFLDAFDNPDDPDGIVTRDEFLAYYASVSSTCEDDSYFDLMMRACWGLPKKGDKKRK